MRRAFLASEEFQKLNPADLAWTSQSAIVLKEIAPSLRLFLDFSDVVIGLNIARDRFEEAEIDFVRRSVRPGDHVVDVGANIGFFSIWMASLVGPLGQVYAYEPLEQNAALLEKSARENGFEDRIVLRRDAVASRGAEGSLVFLSLEQGSQNSGGAYLLSSSEEVPRNHQVLPTRTVSLDAESFVRPIHFLKVDVEGAEPLVFRGARKLLSEDRPVILSEVNPGQIRKVAGSGPAQLIAEMREIGYECTLLEGGHPERVIEDVPDDRVRSVVFRPRTLT